MNVLEHTLKLVEFEVHDAIQFVSHFSHFSTKLLVQIFRG